MWHILLYPFFYIIPFYTTFKMDNSSCTIHSTVFSLVFCLFFKIYKRLHLVSYMCELYCGGHHDSDRMAVLVMVSQAEINPLSIPSCYSGGSRNLRKGGGQGVFIDILIGDIIYTIQAYL